jgi:hypothetical protein
LVVFALIMTGLMLAGAMAFDVGLVMLERRDQQNAADAAALAGARELPDAGTARTKARSIATANGFTQAVDSASVSVGATSTRVIVTISRPVASYFANLLGIANFQVSSTAVAISLQDQPPFAALTALNPHACGALSITGQGVINSWGDIQVNSDCPTSALLISGQGNLQLNHDGLGCWVVGGFQISGKGVGKYCDPPQPGVPLPFPVNGMPSNTATPTSPLQVGGTTKAVPDGCPGTTGYSTTTPKMCQFPSNYGGTTWRLYPGYYPGGIKIQSGTFYLEPGIYHLAGGGFESVATDVSVTSVAPGGTTLGGGVLLFNTTHPKAASGSVSIGGNRNSFNLWPLGGFDPNCTGESQGWNRYLIFQDPAVTTTVRINGGGNFASARGLIVAPSANVQLNGNGGTLTIDAVVSDTYSINGGGGTLNVLFDGCAVPTFTGYGLVV